MKELDPYEKLERENERLRLRNAQLTADNRKYRRRSGGFAIDDAVEEFRDFLSENEDHPVLTPPRNYAAIRGKSLRVFNKDHYEWVGKAWSDWHIGETIRLEDSLGMNRYNSLVASNRVFEDVEVTKRVVTAHRAMYALKGIWIQLLGDMINGSIHEGSLTNDLMDYPAAKLAADLIVMGIDELKTLGLPIEIDCVVGNHPRATVKMPSKRQAQLSLDYIVYEMVQHAYRNDDQVRITINTGQIAARNILGHRYILEHGIGVKSGQEEDFESRLRGVYDDATYREATGLTGSSFDQIVIGNIHKTKFLERTIVNGCLPGQNELGVSWRLKTIRAQQCLWGIAEDRPRTWQYQIDVTNIRSEKADNAFSEYAAWFMQRFGRN